MHHRRELLLGSHLGGAVWLNHSQSATVGAATPIALPAAEVGAGVFVGQHVGRAHGLPQCVEQHGRVHGQGAGQCEALLAFAVLIIVRKAGGSDDLSAFDGLAKRSPFLALALVLAPLAAAAAIRIALT